MENLTINSLEDVHLGVLALVGVALTPVVGLVRGLVSRDQINLFPITLSCPLIDPLPRRFTYHNERCVFANLICHSIEAIDNRCAGRAGIVPTRAKHKAIQEERILVSESS